MQTKVYIVQRLLDDGTLSPEILACKLRHIDAHMIAKEYAPARVTGLVADKTSSINGATDSSRGGSNHGTDRDLPHRHL